MSVTGLEYPISRRRVDVFGPCSGSLGRPRGLRASGGFRAEGAHLGDTAPITAKLWEKGADYGKPFDKTVWFSDTYARTPQGWRYLFGQSSLPLRNGAR
ncbi:MAG: hypothetical protein WA655_08225 [Candidatus Korobacteraceae bacterium]